MAMVKYSAPAKINLFLRILAQEHSGFHQLETLFCRIQFGDQLEIEKRSGGIRLEVEGLDVGPPKENLVYRAAEGFLTLAGLREGVSILLRKNVPPGAGLGGGSSDAASTLMGLAKLFPDRLGSEELLRIAGELGSDVPFFLSPSPLALAWGRGDRIRPLPPLPAAPVLLALPPLEISTPWAFGRLAQLREAVGKVRQPHFFAPESLASWGAIAELAENDFEEIAFQKHAPLERIRRALEEAGSRMSLLSGSGSSLFGVFGDAEVAATAQAHLQGEFPETRFVLTYTES
jgi:4-diphosphocytidyl-2-C-methyl-D-erythritol kinase